ncbi:hypothetical protein C8R44DRAFT_911605 [Mycena epipterygia]|nr:hypothetical protein C8R44DRAFT_911605 [Mycena epipterygia]
MLIFSESSHSSYFKAPTSKGLEGGDGLGGGGDDLGSALVPDLVDGAGEHLEHGRARRLALESTTLQENLPLRAIAVDETPECWDMKFTAEILKEVDDKREVCGAASRRVKPTVLDANTLNSEKSDKRWALDTLERDHYNLSHVYHSAEILKHRTQSKLGGAYLHRRLPVVRRPGVSSRGSVRLVSRDSYSSALEGLLAAGQDSKICFQSPFPPTIWLEQPSSELSPDQTSIALLKLVVYDDNMEEDGDSNPLPSTCCCIGSSSPAACDPLVLRLSVDHTDPFLSGVRQINMGPDGIEMLSFATGSTGIQKGIKKAIPNSVLGGIAHDPIQRDMFTPLFFGAQLHVPTSLSTLGSPGQRLAEWMADSEVTVTHLTQTMGQLLSAPEPLLKRDCIRLPLTTNMCIGDSCYSRLAVLSANNDVQSVHLPQAYPHASPSLSAHPVHARVKDYPRDRRFSIRTPASQRRSAPTSRLRGAGPLQVAPSSSAPQAPIATVGNISGDSGSRFHDLYEPGVPVLLWSTLEYRVLLWSTLENDILLWALWQKSGFADVDFRPNLAPIGIALSKRARTELEDDGTFPCVWPTLLVAAWSLTFDLTTEAARRLTVRHGEIILRVFLGDIIVDSMNVVVGNGDVQIDDLKDLVLIFAKTLMSGDSLLRVLFRLGVYQNLLDCPFDGMNATYPAEVFKIFVSTLWHSANAKVKDSTVRTTLRRIFGTQIAVMVDAHRI